MTAGLTTAPWIIVAVAAVSIVFAARGSRGGSGRSSAGVLAGLIGSRLE